MIRYLCGTEHRRQLVADHPNLNGIDFIEVDEANRERLTVFLLKAPATAPTADQIRIEGGESIRGFKVLNVAGAGKQLTVTLDRQGDFSLYRFRVVAAAGSDKPIPGFDPLLSGVEFSFKAGCFSAFDCRTPRECPEEPRTEPELDYLARDFESFRRLMLDRMRLLAPDWRADSLADAMHALVDLKAWVADYQSYQQDAVATEAYLFTARRRVSVRRHAQLLDYNIHEGANARVWVQFVVDPTQGSAGVLVPERTVLFTEVSETAERLSDPRDIRKALEHGPEVFETLEPATTYAAHNRLLFYTWGDADCCLPIGATAATLLGHLPDLRPGDVLIFEEVRGPKTGDVADADPAHRQAVCLTEVSLGEDPITNPTPKVTNIRWHSRDALTFPLCVAIKPISAGQVILDPWSGIPDSTPVGANAISVARGNIVIADHGRRVPDFEAGRRESLAQVDKPHLRWAGSNAEVPVRVRLTLSRAPVTRSVKREPISKLPLTSELSTELDAGGVPKALARGIEAKRFLPAPLTVRTYAGTWIAQSGEIIFMLVPFGSELLIYDRPAAYDRLRVNPCRAEPDITVLANNTEPWNVVRTLLSSSGESPNLVAETENDGTVTLRAGDGTFGRRPEPDTSFSATYRVGEPIAGNIGADRIRHVISGDAGIAKVRNPLPGVGGVRSESLEEIRQSAPFAFQKQERAVTAEDYAEVARRHPAVQRAVATFRWTGSWYTVFLNVDRFGGREIDQAFEHELRAFFERYRMAGYDVEIEAPIFVPLELRFNICVRPDYFRTDVQRRLTKVFSSRDLPDGTRGVFHPDNFTFGQPMYLSRIYAAAHDVPGVETVNVSVFRRRDDPSPVTVAPGGRILLDRLEIATLDNDPNHPERGLFTLTLEGGK